MLSYWCSSYTTSNFFSLLWIWLPFGMKVIVDLSTNWIDVMYVLFLIHWGSLFSALGHWETVWLSEHRSGLVNLFSHSTVTRSWKIMFFLTPFICCFFVECSTHSCWKVWSSSKVSINHDFQRQICQTEKKIKTEKFPKKSKTGHTHILQGLTKTELKFIVSLVKFVIWQLKNKINLLCLSPAHLVALTIPGIWAPAASQQTMPSAPSAGLCSHFLR